MLVQSFQKYPYRPADFIDRSAEMASRFGGVAAFCLCIAGMVYFFVAV